MEHRARKCLGTNYQLYSCARQPLAPDPVQTVVRFASRLAVEGGERS